MQAVPRRNPRTGRPSFYITDSIFKALFAGLFSESPSQRQAERPDSEDQGRGRFRRGGTAAAVVPVMEFRIDTLWSNAAFL